MTESNTQHLCSVQYAKTHAVLLARAFFGHYMLVIWLKQSSTSLSGSMSRAGLLQPLHNATLGAALPQQLVSRQCTAHLADDALVLLTDIIPWGVIVLAAGSS